MTKVTKVYPDIGPWGSSAIVCELEDGRVYIPYLNDAATDCCCLHCRWPDDKEEILNSFAHWTGMINEEEIKDYFMTYGCPCQACQIDRDPNAWLDMMYGAIDLPDVGDEIDPNDPQIAPYIYDDLPMY